MSVLTYRGITLNILHTLACEREAVYDGRTYLWTRWLIHVRGLYNPGATSYDANLNAPATRQQGLYGAATDVNIRHALMQPRGQLTFTVGNVTLLNTPLPGAQCDANLGPLPVGEPVITIVGDRSFLVDFQVEAFVNECPPGSVGTGNVVLSHLWRAMETMTRQGQYLATRTIEGHVVCRADRLLGQGMVPDDMRAALFHPVYPGTQREWIDVTQHENPHECSYVVLDLERQFNLIANVPGLVDMEVEHSAGTEKIGMDEQALRVFPAVARTGFQIGHILSRANLSNLGVSPAVGMGAAVAGGMLDIGIAVAGMVPRITHHVIVRCWGNRNAFRPALRRLATAVALTRVAAVSGPLATEVFRATDREHDEFVQVEMRAKQGFAGAIFANPGIIQNLIAGNPIGAVGALALQQFTLNTALLPDNTEEIPGVLTKQTAVPNPVPSSPRTDASRGTLFARLVAQALAAPCSLPGAPPAYEAARTTPLT